MSIQRPDILIMGCGRRWRRDDQVGLIVAQRLSAAVGPRAEVMATEAPGAEGLVDRPALRLLIIIDAAEPAPNAPPGTWTCIDYRARPDRIRPAGRADTHTLGIDAALALAAELDLLPPSVLVYAVAGFDFGYGETISPPVQAAADEVCRDILGRVIEPCPAVLRGPT